MLVLGLLAQVAGSFFVAAPVFLLPYFQSDRGLSLAEAGLFAAAPNLGMVLTLVLWGALADRYGERVVIVVGLTVTTVAALAAALSPGGWLVAALLLGGMGAASANAASGRVVVGWFDPRRRGLAMGIRQMAQPLGVALAGLVVPAVSAAGGIPAAFLVPFAAGVLVSLACALWIVNPPRPAASSQTSAVTTNPYRADRTLLRIHAVSCLLVFPQYVVATFGVVWLTALGWSPVAAGAVVGLSQLVGAVGRIGVGAWSDRVASRMGPLRWVSMAAIVVMLLMSVSGQVAPVLAPVILVLAATVTVADNGLEFTAVAEIAGPSWAGRALGIQNTGQYVAAAAVGPAMGLVISLIGFPLGFAITAVFPLLSLPLIPRQERLSTWR